MKLYMGFDSVRGLIPLFDFRTEMNIPTLYSSFALIICSILLWFISIKHYKAGSSHIPWFGLAILFVFLSVDETARTL